MDPKETMFKLTVADIQTYAIDNTGKALTNEELLIISDELKAFIEWKPIVENTLNK